MMLYLFLIVLCVFLGTAALWFSGFFFARTAAANAVSVPSPTEAVLANAPTLPPGGEGALVAETQLLIAERDDAMRHVQDAVAAKNKAEDEVSRIELELAQLDAQLGKSHEENHRLQAELEALQQRPKPPLPAPPLPAPNMTHGHQQDELDAMAAQLDLEKVAHQKTREELEALRKNAAAPQPPARKFATMAFAAPPRLSLIGGEEEGVSQGTLEKLQAEKDDLEAELRKARKEIQFLKMRDA
ncbi:MAG: hypothetical protein M0R76_12930 [Proteobacteria bacterium]|nr:hypothetical protein [Pseudomonadota bacterium]